MLIVLIFNRKFGEHCQRVRWAIGSSPDKQVEDGVRVAEVKDTGPPLFGNLARVDGRPDEVQRISEDGGEEHGPAVAEAHVDLRRHWEGDDKDEEGTSLDAVHAIGHRAEHAVVVHAQTDHTQQQVQGDVGHSQWGVAVEGEVDQGEHDADDVEDDAEVVHLREKTRRLEGAAVEGVIDHRAEEADANAEVGGSQEQLICRQKKVNNFFRVKKSLPMGSVKWSGKA